MGSSPAGPARTTGSSPRYRLRSVSLATILSESTDRRPWNDVENIAYMYVVWDVSYGLTSMSTNAPFAGTTVTTCVHSEYSPPRPTDRSKETLAMSLLGSLGIFQVTLTSPFVEKGRTVSSSGGSGGIESRT